MRRPPAASPAFSLLEVVIAVGVFALGMMAVFGLFTPVAKSVTGISEAEAAARVAELLDARLRGESFATVAALLKRSTTDSHELTVADAKSDYDISTDTQLLFASRDGLKIGTYSDAVWLDATAKTVSNRDKFFEIALIRNETLSPAAALATSNTTATADPDDTAAVLAFTVRIRWPAYVADTGTGAIQVGSNPTGTVKYDHGMKQVLFFTGAVRR